MSDKRSVLGRYDQYRFGEAPIGDRAQIRVQPTPALPTELPPLTALDPGLEQLHVALERQLLRTPVAPLDYAPGRATTWLLCSPFEVFLEHVFAKKLGTLE